jgi:hypothetical protein
MIPVAAQVANCAGASPTLRQKAPQWTIPIAPNATAQRVRVPRKPLKYFRYEARKAF